MPKLTIWDQRMLKLMQHCIDTDKVRSKREFFQKIGFQETGLRQVRAGVQSFTMQQMVKACTLYKINMNWLAGFDQQMTRGKSTSSIQLLKEAVRSVEAEMNGK